MLSMAASTSALDLDLLKSHLHSLFCDMTITPTLALVGEISKGLVRDFTNSKIFLKLSGPYLFMLSDPSIRNPIST